MQAITAMKRLKSLNKVEKSKSNLQQIQIAIRNFLLNNSVKKNKLLNKVVTFARHSTSAL